MIGCLCEQQELLSEYHRKIHSLCSQTDITLLNWTRPQELYTTLQVLYQASFFLSQIYFPYFPAFIVCFD